MQPSAQTSVRRSTGLPLACSGLMYGAVPSTTPAPVSAGFVIVGAFDTPSAEFWPGADIVHLRVSADGFERMTRSIQAEYLLDAAGTPVRMGRGYYERSWFYQARSRYHVIFSNSNSWVASALRAGGLPMEPGVGLTAEGVIAQASAISAQRPSR